jgi:DNA-binding response OmpR family regulator
VPKRVLLVDDDPHIQELIKFFLKSSGLEIVICKDGFTAIDEMYARKCDLVILDISMPHMNGFQTLKNMRQNPETAATPVIMLTGSKDKTDVVKAGKFGITDFILKPPIREDFVARVEKIVGPVEENISVGFTEGDEASNVEVTVSLQLVSVDFKSLILRSPIPLPKGLELNLGELQLFRQLDFETFYFYVGDCIFMEEKKFDYEVPLQNLTSLDQQKLKLWLKTKAFPDAYKK